MIYYPRLSCEQFLLWEKQTQVLSNGPTWIVPPPIRHLRAVFAVFQRTAVTAWLLAAAALPGRGVPLRKSAAGSLFVFGNHRSIQQRPR